MSSLRCQFMSRALSVSFGLWAVGTQMLVTLTISNLEEYGQVVYIVTNIAAVWYGYNYRTSCIDAFVT